MGTPPTCLLNLKKAIYKPKVFAMLEAGLPQAAQAVASAPAGAHLSASLSYLLYLIKMGDGFLNLRRNFNSFIVGLAATKFSELKVADNYKFLLQ